MNTGKKEWTWYKILALCLVFVGTPLIFLFSSSYLGDRTSAEQLTMVERTIRQAAVQCYALEGGYPYTLEDLIEQYGLYVDETEYFVDYRFIASNLMPDITVLFSSGERTELFS